MHVWGCPAFVLDTKLKDGHRIPKFNLHGQFLGFLDEHSTLMAQICNLSMNFVSPQFHVVFDDLFSMIKNISCLEDSVGETIFEKNSKITEIIIDRNL